MENINPVGVHTGDSIVVAPAQTLADKEFQMLRTSAIKIISALKIEGGCNVQFALNPNSFEYAVIEVNPRVSRSSALASKATGYPIAKVAAKIAVGYTLDEIKNAVTGKTYACFEPVVDYVVVKIPKWPFNKFKAASRELGTQMKATGEVMAISDNLEAGIMKAIRSLEENVDSLYLPKYALYTDNQLREELKQVNNETLWIIAECLRRGMTINQIHEATTIDVFFIGKINNLVKIEEELKTRNLSVNLLKKVKKYGYTDKVISRLTKVTVEEIRKMRKENNIEACFKMVDTCAAEFDAETPYYYSSYDDENEAKRKRKQ